MTYMDVLMTNRKQEIRPVTRMYNSLGRSRKVKTETLNMKIKAAAILFILPLLLALAFAGKVADVKTLQIGVKHKPATCELKARKGDKVRVHYRGKLTDGTVFDSSFERGDPIAFELGVGQVIKGWDQGILGMCIGEKRKLKIPAHMGYGDQGSPPTIPGGATLIFDTELVEILGRDLNNHEEL